MTVVESGAALGRVKRAAQGDERVIRSALDLCDLPISEARLPDVEARPNLRLVAPAFEEPVGLRAFAPALRLPDAGSTDIRPDAPRRARLARGSGTRGGHFPRL